MYVLLLRPGHKIKDNGKYDIKDVATGFDIVPLIENTATFTNKYATESIGGVVTFNEKGQTFYQKIEPTRTSIKGDTVQVKQLY